MDEPTVINEERVATVPRGTSGWEGGAASGLHPRHPPASNPAPATPVRFDATGWPDLSQRPIPPGGRTLRDTRTQMESLRRWTARGCHIGIGACLASLWLLMIELNRVDEWLLLPGILLVFFTLGAVRAHAPLPTPTQTQFFEARR